MLIEAAACTEEQIAEALAASYGLPFARVSPRLTDPKVIGLLPRDFLERHSVLPLFLVDDVLTVAVPEPADVFLIDEVERVSGRAAQLVVATARDIAATLREYVPSDLAFQTRDLFSDVPEGAFAISPCALHEREGVAGAGSQGSALPNGRTPSERLLLSCLFTAIKAGASAAHFEPGPDGLRIRWRVDGEMVDKARPPLRLHEGLLRSVRVYAGLGDAPGHLAQEGRLNVIFEGKPLQLTASIVPGRGGHRLVIGIPGLEKTYVSLEQLGFGYDMLKQWRRLLALSQGLLVVTGPADSGKLTTLYASIEHRNAAGINVCTVESPISYVIPGVNQFQVAPKANFGTAEALAAVLGQDPDVVMVHELADRASALAVARGALGGKLILAGMQATDAPLALAHLSALGVEPYAVGSVVAGVLAQRLVRKLCQSCREPYEPSKGERRQLDAIVPGITLLYRPKGCERCRQSGFAGRVGVFELLVPDDAMTERLAQGASLSEIRGLARSSGTRPMRIDGLDKVKAGVTTLDEVIRATA